MNAGNTIMTGIYQLLSLCFKKQKKKLDIFGKKLPPSQNGSFLYQFDPKSYSILLSKLSLRISVKFYRTIGHLNKLLLTQKWECSPEFGPTHNLCF